VEEGVLVEEGLVVGTLHKREAVALPMLGDPMLLIRTHGLLGHGGGALGLGEGDEVVLAPMFRRLLVEVED